MNGLWSQDVGREVTPAVRTEGRKGSQAILMEFFLPSDYRREEWEEVTMRAMDDQLASQGWPKGCLKEAARLQDTGSTTTILTGPGDSLLTIRFLTVSQLMTVTLQAPFIGSTCSAWKNNQVHSGRQLVDEIKDEVLQLEERLAELLPGCQGSSALPLLTRGLELSPYWTTTDDRVAEVGITGVLHDSRSDHQRIQIITTTDFGRLLLLDGQCQLAESDLCYTVGLMAEAREEYRDKDVLILGGGDGALLCQLLKKSPRQVTMAELDPGVMAAVREHMPSVCEGALDTLEGPRHRIVVGDALKYLEQQAQLGTKWDYVFGDLTDCPIDAEGDEEGAWSLITTVLRLSLPNLKAGGKYLTHVSGKGAPQVKTVFRKKATEVCQELGLTLDIHFTETYVPSFLECWVFAQLTVSS